MIPREAPSMGSITRQECIDLQQLQDCRREALQTPTFSRTTTRKTFISENNVTLMMETVDVKVYVTYDDCYVTYYYPQREGCNKKFCKSSSENKTDPPDHLDEEKWSCGSDRALCSSRISRDSNRRLNREPFTALMTGKYARLAHKYRKLSSTQILHAL